jgi:cerevisin
MNINLESINIKSRIISFFGSNHLPGFPRGYAITLNGDQLQQIRANSQVQHVEPDQMMHTTKDLYKSSNNKSAGKKRENDAEVQDHAPWGLARISHIDRPEGPEFKTDYVYPENAGENVTVYVIDTGVNIAHVEFEGRAVWGKTIPDDDGDVSLSNLLLFSLSFIKSACMGM